MKIFDFEPQFLAMQINRTIILGRWEYNMLIIKQLYGFIFGTTDGNSLKIRELLSIINLWHYMATQKRTMTLRHAFIVPPLILIIKLHTYMVGTYTTNIQVSGNCLASLYNYHMSLRKSTNLSQW